MMISRSRPVSTAITRASSSWSVSASLKTGMIMESRMRRTPWLLAVENGETAGDQILNIDQANQSTVLVHHGEFVNREFTH